ncbi:MAG TPA: hypothetical protein DEF45_17150 [Rhodopirellula sp.]|nr:hypothetical protein [Rhodopirellula sp.]
MPVLSFTRLCSFRNRRRFVTDFDRFRSVCRAGQRLPALQIVKVAELSLWSFLVSAVESSVRLEGGISDDSIVARWYEDGDRTSVFLRMLLVGVNVSMCWNSVICISCHYRFESDGASSGQFWLRTEVKDNVCKSGNQTYLGLQL